jgi:mannosylglycerate hydrolase
VDSGDRGDLYNYCPPELDTIIHTRMSSFEREQTVCSQQLIVHYELKLPKSISADRKSRSTKKVPCFISSTFLVVNGIPRVDIHTEFDNQAFDHRLSVEFPAPFSCTTALYDGHFELVQRYTDLPKWDQTWEEQPRPEVPQRDFTLVTDTLTSLTIANRGLPEVSVTKNQVGNAVISYTLLRSIGWLSLDDLSTRKGHAGPMGMATPGAQMIGKHSFDYSIIPSVQNINHSIQQAHAFSSPIKAKTEPIHAGSLLHHGSFIENTNPNFLITAVKQSQDNSGLVVRGYNQISSAIEVKVKFNKTYQQAYRINLAEEPIEPLPITSRGEIIFSAIGNQIFTILLKD